MPWLFAATSMLDFLRPYHPVVTCLVIVGIFAGLQVRRGVPTDLLFLAGVVVLTAFDVLSPSEAFAGFANVAVLTIAGLYVVTAALRGTGVLDWLGNNLLGSAKTERDALWRLAAVLLPSSAFLLNTPIVAMMAPVVVDWCRRRSVSPSRLLIPLSYLTILGGTLTLIGTSTTIVANGKLELLSRHRREEAERVAREHPHDAKRVAQARDFAAKSEPLHFFEIGWIGLPCALVGTAYLVFAGTRMLPNRGDMLEQLGETRREYLVEMLVRDQCPLIGKTIEQAGLRRLPGLFLIEIDREGDLITPVTPHDVIHAHDRLVFTGVVRTIVDLEKIPGLAPAADMNYEFHPVARQQRHLTEVVLSPTSPLLGSTLKDANFRQLYNAAVVAVHRNGRRVGNKLGDIQLEAGDTLLLQTRHEFVPTYRNSPDFYLVSPVEGSEARRHHRAAWASGLVLALMAWLTLSSVFPLDDWLPGLASPAVAAAACAVALVATGCIRFSQARASLDLQTLLTVASALALGVAMEQSGASTWIAHKLVAGFSSPWIVFVLVLAVTMMLTELITNVAVAALMIPLVVDAAAAGGFSPRPLIVAVIVGASMSFISPIGYQTNLMVMGPGGYRPVDYLRCGLPLSLLVFVTCGSLIPLIWPF